MLKIGSVDYVFAYPGGGNYADYERMAKTGFECAHYHPLSCKNDPLHTMSEKEFEKAIAEEAKRAHDAGISFAHVHGLWPIDDTTEEARAQNLEGMKRCIRGTAMLDCPYLIVHPQMPYAWEAEKDPAYAVALNETYFRTLCEYAAGFNVGICIENMPSKKHTLADCTSLVAFVKRLNYPNFSICLDTGHVNVLGQDCGEMVRACGSLLKALHVHDNNGMRDEHLPPYFGTIRWESFKIALAEIGFTGCLSLEVLPHGGFFPELYEHLCKGLVMTARYLADI